MFASAEEALETDKILQFLDLNKFPLVITLTELNSAKVYSSARTLQVFFHSALCLMCLSHCVISF